MIIAIIIVSVLAGLIVGHEFGAVVCLVLIGCITGRVFA